MSKISRAPARPPATGPNDPRYADPRDLEAELRRVFQICHECRMCVGYCGAFPELFRRVDRAIESGRAEGAETLGREDFAAVTDACWQCKLCYIKCPYTPDEGAYEMLDFPRQLAREKAARSAREGVPLVDQILGEPQALGALASGVLAPAANLVSASRLLRKVQEAATGISAEFPLPGFAREPFSDWCASHAPLASAGRAGEVALFPTCYGEYNFPGVPRAAVRVLEHNGYAVRLASELTCCGMPNLDGGDVEAVRQKVKRNVAALLPHVRAGRKIVVPGPTCGYMMKKEWTEYVAGDDVRAVSGATVDLMEFLLGLGRSKALELDFPNKLGKVAYHMPCHLRAQKIGSPGQRLLARAAEDVQLVEQCSAVDGTWGMKAVHYEEGRRYARKLSREIAEAEVDLVVSDCSLAGLRISKENGVLPLHPIEALAEAYGLLEGKSGKGRKQDASDRAG